MYAHSVRPRGGGEGRCSKVRITHRAVRSYLREREGGLDFSLLQKIKGFLNRALRIGYYSSIKVSFILNPVRSEPICLHLGCGERRIEGHINIDWVKTGATDAVCDIRKLPYPAGSVEHIVCFHVIEHLPRRDVMSTLAGWHRVLKPGGRLVIECPDFDEIVRRYLDGDEKQLEGIFGHQRFDGDAHFFGYNVERLTSILAESGFENIVERDPEDYHSMQWPCIRIECTKAVIEIS